jgi:hypothetical protein
MLYKFKSQVAGDLIMLEPNGRRVLEVIGKEASAKGIILPEQIPEAVQALNKAAVAQAKANGDVPPTFDAVNLRKRAMPFIEMLQRCAKEKASVTWGV